MAGSDDIESSLLDEFRDAVDAGLFDPELNDFMDDVVQVWKGNAPEDTGAYRESIGVTQPASRGKGKVGSNDLAAISIEYGTVDTPEHGALRKTIEQVTRR